MTDTFATPLTATIVRAARALAAVQERSPSAVVRRCGGDPGDYERMTSGGDVLTAKANRILDGLRAKWPPGLEWPG